MMPMLDMTNAKLCLVAALACVATPANAQSPESLDLTAVGKDPRWKIAGRTTSIVDIKGKRALKPSESEGIGVMWLDGYDFADGVIELTCWDAASPLKGALSASRSGWSMGRRTTRCTSGHSTFVRLTQRATVTPCNTSPGEKVCSVCADLLPGSISSV